MEYLLFPIHFQIIPRDAFFLVSLPPWIGEQGVPTKGSYQRHDTCGNHVVPPSLIDSFSERAVQHARLTARS